jgi:hypothetical protein
LIIDCNGIARHPFTSFALFLILTMNTDRALPPSIAFSAMMTPMMTDFKVLFWTFACSRLKNESYSYASSWLRLTRIMVAIRVPDACPFRVLDCSTNVSGTQ